MSYLVTAEYNGKDTGFVFAKNGTDNKLYILTEDQIYDAVSDRPLTRLYTKAYNFDRNNPASESQFAHADIWMADVQGQADCTIYYRPKGYAYWMACGSFTVCADTAGDAQYRRRIRVQPTEDSVCNADEQSVRTATEFEFCIQITGHARIDRCIFFVDNTEDSWLNGCDVSSTCVELSDSEQAGESLDNYEYEVLT